MAEHNFQHCPECLQLLEAYIAAVRETRRVLEMKEKAAQAGVLDDVDFLDTEADFDRALCEQERAHQAYACHRQERHG